MNRWNCLRDELNTATNLRTFWRAIKPFRPKPPAVNPILEDQWKQFYTDTLPLRTTYLPQFTDVWDIDHDRPIDPEEVNPNNYLPMALALHTDLT
jgi:hypothetical protein